MPKYKYSDGETGEIYKLSEPIPDNDPNAKEWLVRYIGKSESWTERYAWTSKKLDEEDIRQMSTTRDVDRWIREMLLKGIDPKMEVIEEDIPLEDLSVTETRWIRYWRPLVAHIKPLLNANDGDGTSPVEGTIKKMKNSQKAREGKRRPSKRRTKIISEKGLLAEREVEVKHYARPNKPIYQCDQDGNIICEWESINLAAKKLGLPQQNIGRSCRATAKNQNPPSFCGGCRWKYKEIPEPEGNPILQLDINENFIREWKSSSEIQKEFGIHHNIINRICRKNLEAEKLHTYKDQYIWKFKYDRDNSFTQNKIEAKILQQDKQNNTIKEWLSVGEICKELGVAKTAIVQCCNANKERPYRNYTHHDFVWRWAAVIENKELNNLN